MSSWLDPIEQALDEAPGSITFFFRDDDAGWRDDRLDALLELCDRFAAPLDLAVIPRALTPETARKLAARVDLAPSRLGLHQHGFTHGNHEPSGRKHEFGPARDADAQRRDIACGLVLLRGLLGEAVDPIFTPPWNRCTAVTGACLAELGFAALSRESRARPLGVPGLRELPVHVDWQRRGGGADVAHGEIGEALATHARAGGPVGVMLHHAVMTDADVRALTGLHSLLRGHEKARITLMRDLIGLPAPHQPRQVAVTAER